MSDVISVTVPNDAKSIEKARDFLAEMASLAGSAANVPGPRTGADVSPPAPPSGEHTEQTSAPTPPPPPATGGQSEAPPPPAGKEEPELDVDGLPWDERIHASTKKKTQDGRWKKKRGIDDATREAVEMQLRHKAGSPPAKDDESNKAPAAPAMSFASFMAEVKTRNPSYEAIASALESEGLSELPDLATQPGKVQAVYNELFGDNE